MIKDIYVMENTSDDPNYKPTLKNKLNITDYDELNMAEADIGFVKLIDIDKFSKNRIDKKLFKDVHKHVFEDIFDWAGEYRTVPIYKEELVLLGYSVPYTECKDIDKMLDKRIKELNSIDFSKMDEEELSTVFARKIAQLWRVHPFRDGNTRTTLSFAYLFAKKHGFPFSLEPFLESLDRKYDEAGNICRYSVRDKFVLACLDDEYNPEVQHLSILFKKAINNYGKTKEEVKTSRSK